MFGIILISHGNLALEMLNSVKMIMGDIENIEVLTLMPEDDPAMIESSIKDIISKSEGGSYIIAADLYGGSPSLNAVKTLSENVSMVTGMNLPMIIELISQRNSGAAFKDAVNAAVNAAKDGVILCNI